MRRGALLLPLSLALCGDSFNMSGGCGSGRPKDPDVVQLACTLELAGAISGPVACVGYWSYLPVAGASWSIDLYAVPAGPLVPPWATYQVETSGPGEVGVAYGHDAAAPAHLTGRSVRAVSAAGLGYRATAFTLSFTSVAPLEGTFEAALDPALVESPSYQSPPYSFPAGPAGTSVTMRGTFRQP